jgi:predicted transcriptional regulator of viral defense system
MNRISTILTLAKTHHGTVTSSMVSEAGIPRYYLKQLTDRNLLLKVTRGVYVLPEVWEDELFILQYTYKRGIFSHETALWLLGFSDRTPEKYTMTFPFGYHLSKLATKITVKQAIEDLYELGVTEINSPGGHPVTVYSIERTLCDIIRGKNALDIQLVTQAMKRYLSLKGRNIPLLLEYAGKLRVLEKVRPYVEALV